MSQGEFGQVITFYSYKGGTGRSMALANVACLLARRHSQDKGVLMVDWDLDAPGLHRFFWNKFKNSSTKSDQDVALEAKQGLIDLFTELDKVIRSRKQFTEEDSDALFADVDLDAFILKSDIPSLFLLKAGRFDKDYTRRVNTFQWESLYQKAPWLIRSFAEKLAKQFRYVLIDSRTGITDIGGLCTSLLPDRLVAVFTPNRQSIIGLLDVLRRATDYRKQSDDLRPLAIFPLPSRIELTEPTLRDEWRYGNREKGIVGYQPQFEDLFRDVYDLPQCDLQSYFDEVQIQHVPGYAYGEEVAVVVEKGIDRLSLSRSYTEFADRLTKLASAWQRFDQSSDLQRGEKRSSYNVFVATPGDVLPERKVVWNVIAQINSVLESLNIHQRLEGKAWDRYIHPDQGSPENLILKRISIDECDIFICILWKRFGMLTGVQRPDDGKPYLSGTEQEIMEAIQTNRRTGHRPIIMFYRKVSKHKGKMSADAKTQLKHVNDFFREFEAGGKYPMLYTTFEEAKDFEDILRTHLLMTLQDITSRKISKSGNEDAHLRNE